MSFHWIPDSTTPAFSASDMAPCIERFREPLHLLWDEPNRRIGAGLGGRIAEGGGWPLHGTLPPIYPEWLGERAFIEAHGLRFPYVAGEMAQGIASPRMVAAMAEAGMLGFFGAAGLSLERVEAALHEMKSLTSPWGANLIHAPADSEFEMALVDLYLANGVRRVSASAFMNITPNVVAYAAAGLRRDSSGCIVRLNHLFAKISRPEVARAFLSPAPPEMLDALLSAGRLSPEEADLARCVPLAEDVTVEADSGGHTDNRPLSVLLPAILALRGELSETHNYENPPRIGAAGGLGTPMAVAAAFALGAAYVLTGSINQACVESGLSDEARAMLALSGLADVAMAPAGDMFELGARVQVLKRGTLFPARAQRLGELYAAYDSLEALPLKERERLERDVFHSSLEAIWEETRSFFQTRDKAQIERAMNDPKHRMALVFRWYLGSSSRWAIEGRSERKLDYQIWCGPAQGAFNAWAAGSFLEPLENRGVVQVALNLLEGAACVTRAQQLRSAGLPVSSEAFTYRPRPLSIA